MIRENGEEPTVRLVDGEEHERRLLAKLDEEVEEYRESRDVEELADVLEVVHALAGRHGVGAGDLERIRERKADDRGRFEDGVVLERVEE